MSRLETIGEHVSENRRGMFVDLVFAMAWVTVVTLLFDFLQAPQWAYYLAMFGGVVAYYGFFWSLEAAKEGT
ncbi:hypothetical protein AUR64_09525 [Haloprofundus marisrubri]|uniref:DUF8119 domain-containing protein n=1 Tax=Haloprofundus marisrubri TaxID=1514971 RepID=A0A0W1RAS6_9EURY|nr:hypothetical protein [Haloprofundus marisrubri]KTG09859.1 hypothetical protein AUR64_09525 [Haloprofundus marisrubri]